MFPYICFFGLKIPSYGLCMTSAIILCSYLIIRQARRYGILFEDIIILIAVSVGMGLFGGGLVYIAVTYTFEEIFNYIRNLEFSFLLNNGIVFYGGLIGGIVGAFVSAKILNIKMELLERCIVPYIPLGHAIGRIGCLLAGCCYGFEYNEVFAVGNRVVSAYNTYFPIQAIESLANLIIMLVIFAKVKRKHITYSILCYYLTMYSVVRFILEFFRGDEIRGKFMFLSTSQWISLSVFCFSAVILFKIKKEFKTLPKN